LDVTAQFSERKPARSIGFGSSEQKKVSAHGCRHQRRLQHHRTGDPLSRATSMMVLDPDVCKGEVSDLPAESIDLVPTLAALCTGHDFAGDPMTTPLPAQLKADTPC